MNRIIPYLVGISAIGCMALLAPAIDALAQADGAAIGPAATDVPQVETHTVFPTQDTYVDSTPVNADISFTDAEDLLLGRVNLGATSLRQRSYLRFDLSAIPQGATIQNAQLDLFQTVGSLNPILVYQAVNDWDAAETTWNNQPDFSVVDAWNAPATTDQYVTYAGDNLTVLVQTWVNAPVRNYGLMLDTSATSGDARQFHSVDRRSGQPPRLRFAVALPPIRVCDDPDCLKPSSGIEVVNRSTGKAYTTDTTGYVLDAGAIQLGDSLWGNAIMEQTAAAARYITTGDPQTVNAAAFVTYPGLNLPEMRLILQKPLLVRNLQVSAQWNLEGDPSYKTELAARIVDASDHFYRYTDGQFALGRVTVYQNYERWDDPVTDLWLHTNNAMRPLSYIKGDVLVQTADPMTPTVDFIYEPGHVYIGSDLEPIRCAVHPANPAWHRHKSRLGCCSGPRTGPLPAWTVRFLYSRIAQWRCYPDLFMHRQCYGLGL